ncbi:MAG: hypothetical protein ACKESB_01000 [Candidatus Hodgkinia cicadicola]
MSPKRSKTGFAHRGIKEVVKRVEVFVGQLRGLAVVADQFASKANSKVRRRTPSRGLLWSMKSVDYFEAEALKHKYFGGGGCLELLNISIIDYVLMWLLPRGWQRFGKRHVTLPSSAERYLSADSFKLS